MVGLLRATSGPLTGSEFRLGGRTLVGRAGEADIQLMEQAVSRRHALILRRADGHFWIGDLSSTNGTFMGEERLEEHCLRPGDVIHLGKSTFVYREMALVPEMREATAADDLHLLSGPAELATQGLSLSWLQRIWARQRREARKGASDTLPIHLSERRDGPRAARPASGALSRRR